MATRRTKALLQVWDTSGVEQAGEGTAHQWKSVYTDYTNNKNALFQYQQKDRIGQPQTCKMSLLNPSIVATQAMLVNESVDDSETSILVDNVTGGGLPVTQSPVGSYVRIDSEIMKITGHSSITINVERGALGTDAVAHDDNSQVLRDPRGGTRGYVESVYSTNLKQLSRIRIIDSITKAILFVGRIYSMHVRQDVVYGSVIELVAFDHLKELSDNRLQGKHADFSTRGSTGTAKPKVSDIIPTIISHFTYNTVDGTTLTPANLTTLDTLKFNASVASTADSPDYSRGNHTGLSAISREALSDPHSASTSETTPDSAFGYTYYIDSNYTSAVKTANPSTYPAAFNYFKRESIPEVAANLFYNITSKGSNSIGSSANSYATTAVTMSDFDMTRTHSDVITDLSVTVGSQSGDPMVLNCIPFSVSNQVGPDSGSFSYSSLFNGKSIEESPKVFIDSPGAGITPVYVGKFIFISADSGDAIAVIALDNRVSTISPASLLFGRSGTYSTEIATNLLIVPFEENGVQTTATSVQTVLGSNSDAYSRVRANATPSTTFEVRRMSTSYYDARTRAGTGKIRRAIGAHFIARDGLNTPRRGSFHISEFPMAQVRVDPTSVGNTQITVPSGAGHPDTRGIRKGMVVRQLDADGAETGKFGYISGVTDGSYNIDVTLYNVSTENEGGTHVAQATTNWGATDQADIYVPIRAGHVIHVTNPYLHISGDALITEVDYDEGPGLQTTTMKYVMDNPAALIEAVKPTPMLATLDTDGAGVASRAQSARVVPNSGTTVLTKGSYQQVNWPAQKLYIGSERYDIASGNSTTANGGSAISNSEWSAIYFKPDSEGGSDIEYDVDTVANIRANSPGEAIIISKIRASTASTGDPEWEPQVSMPQGAQYDGSGDVFKGELPSSLFSDGNKSFTSDLEWTGVSNTEVGWSNGSSGNGTVTLSDGTALTITKSTNGSGVGYNLSNGTYYFYIQGLAGTGTYSMAKSTTASDASGDAKILLATVGVDTTLDVKPVILPYNSKKPSISAVAIQADGIVADSIDSLAITSKHTITGATIQTSASANTGIKIGTTANKIIVYDSSNGATDGSLEFRDDSGNLGGSIRRTAFSSGEVGASLNVLAFYAPLSSNSITDVAYMGVGVGHAHAVYDAVSGATANTKMLVEGSIELKQVDSGNPANVYFSNNSGAVQGGMYMSGGTLTVKGTSLEGLAYGNLKGARFYSDLQADTGVGGWSGYSWYGGPSTPLFGTGSTSLGADTGMAAFKHDSTGNTYLSLHSDGDISMTFGDNTAASTYHYQSHYTKSMYPSGGGDPSTYDIGYVNTGGTTGHYVYDNIVGTSFIMTTHEGGTSPSLPASGTTQSFGAVFTKRSNIYASAEVWAKDAAGNLTQLSPHDENGNWIFHAHNEKTGKTLKIHMEKLMRKLNDELGGDFIEEYTEEL